MISLYGEHKLFNGVLFRGILVICSVTIIFLENRSVLETGTIANAAGHASEPLGILSYFRHLCPKLPF